MSHFYSVFILFSDPFLDNVPCDHSDEKRRAYLGLTIIDYNKLEEYYSIPIIDVKSPQRRSANDKDWDFHDFALFILKRPATFSRKVLPICLPYQGQEFYNRKVTVAGWGLYGPDSALSRKLRIVDLRVSTDSTGQCKMFRSEIGTNWFGLPKDTCAGDSGAE